MSTIKTDRIDYEKLLNGIDPIKQEITQKDSSSNTEKKNSVVDNNGSSNEMFEGKIFDFDYNDIRKTTRKRVRKSIISVVEHVIPKDLLEDQYIQDKIEQDIDTMLGLYMQVEMNTTMQRSMMEQVSRGAVIPRMYEVFSQLTDKIKDLNKQIVDTEQRIRKTYMDIKYEIRDKQAENFGGNLSNNTNQIGMNGNTSNGIVFSSTKDLNNSVKEMMKAKSLSNIKETKYTEVK